jgi:uncharacterized protein (TIRG00374 family)
MKQGRHARIPRRRWWKPVLLTVGVLVAVAGLRGRLPAIGSTWTALGHARPAWLLLAALMQVVSMTAFSEQQRHLLGAFGVRMTARASLVLAYAHSSMSAALPGGTAISAGYTFRQYRARGASQPIAAAVMLLSGVASVSGLVLLYGTDLLAWTTPPVRTVTIAAACAVVLLAVLLRVRRPWSVPEPPPAIRLSRVGRTRLSRSGRTLLSRLGRTLRETAVLARAVAPRRWLAVVALAGVNWATELAVLLVSLHAVGLNVPLRTVATAFLLAQLVRQIPVTPGGIGVIEASLIVALTTAGAAAAPAAAAVLIYRVLSFWSTMPIGLICYASQKTPAPALAEPARELVTAPAR